MTEDTGTPCENRSTHSLLAHLDPPLMTYYYGTFSVLMLVNVVGNTIVLRTILRHDSLRTPANSLICSLAASDLLFGLLYPIYNVSHIDLPVIENSLGEWSVCRIIMTEVLALELCSSYGLVAIALSRHFIVAHPLRYRQYLNTRSCSVVIVTLWVVAHIICVIVYAKESPPQGYCNICRFEMMYPLTHLTILTAMQFLLPFIIMVVSNVRMAYTARALQTRTEVGSTSVGHQAQCRWKCGLHLRQKSVVVVTLLVGCFALAWAPQLLYLFLVIVGMLEETQFEYLGATVRIFLYCNSAVNVFIYAGRMADFRRHVRRDLGHLVCRCSPRVTPSRVTAHVTLGKNNFIVQT